MAKMNTNTRVPTAPLEAIVEKTKLGCRLGREALSVQFPRLTAEDRKAAAKPAAGFTKTARKAIEGANEFKTLFARGRRTRQDDRQPVHFDARQWQR